MTATLVKPLALVDNKTGHIMLLIDARTLTAEIDGGMGCELQQDEASRYILQIATQPEPTVVGPFSRGEAEKIRLCHRLTVAAFKDGIVTRAREVALKVTV